MTIWKYKLGESFLNTEPTKPPFFDCEFQKIRTFEDNFYVCFCDDVFSLNYFLMGDSVFLRPKKWNLPHALKISTKETTPIFKMSLNNIIFEKVGYLFYLNLKKLTKKQKAAFEFCLEENEDIQTLNQFLINEWRHNFTILILQNK